MSKIRTVLFDLDGTLLDSKKLVVDAIYHTLEHFMPKRYEYDAVEARFGMAFEPFLASLIPERKEEVLDYFNRYTLRYHDEAVQLFPGVEEILQQLTLEGYQLGLVTNKTRSLTNRALQLFDLEEFFSVIITLDDVRCGKPDPEPLYRACSYLQVKPAEAVLIGDSQYDRLAAKAAGMPFCFVGSDPHNVKALK